MSGLAQLMANCEESVAERLEQVRSYVLPMEHARMRAPYRMGSRMAKTLILESEALAGRVRLLLLDEVLGR